MNLNSIINSVNLLERRTFDNLAWVPLSKLTGINNPITKQTIDKIFNNFTTNTKDVKCISYITDVDSKNNTKSKLSTHNKSQVKSVADCLRREYRRASKDVSKEFHNAMSGYVNSADLKHVQATIYYTETETFIASKDRHGMYVYCWNSRTTKPKYRAVSEHD